MKHLAMAGVFLAMIGATPAATAEPIDVMVLGTWHFDNPGRDLNNVKADDVLQPQRQAELEALTNALAAFKPTKIMIEATAKTPDLIDGGFAAFTPSTLGKERNETVQIAYRLAHRLGHKKVYAIDEQPDAGEPDYFPYGKVMDFAKSNGREAELQTAMAQAGEATRVFDANQSSMTIPALLVGYNDPAGFQSSIDVYYDILKMGNSVQQPGAELNAMWYLRNAKIFAKLMRVAEPGDRILVVYGGGHNYWLRHFASETPGFRNVDPAPYLKEAAGTGG